MTSLRSDQTINANDVAEMLQLADAMEQIGEPACAFEVTRVAAASARGVAEVHVRLGECLLRRGSVKEGWREYEWRHRLVDGEQRVRRHEPTPVSVCDDLNGTVVRLVEQDTVCDAIQFARYVRFLRQRGAEVVLGVRPALRPLFEQLAGISATMDRAELLHRNEPVLDLKSLPFLLQMEVIPGAVPYLFAPRQAALARKAELSRCDALKIGVSGWSDKAGNVSRQAPTLADFARLADHPGVRLFDLQSNVINGEVRELRSNGHLVRMPAQTDPEQAPHHAAALISGLDLVVCADGVIAHLAGAMGKPTWVALPLGASWCWMEEGTDTPWYPTARLYRQRRRGRWNDVFDRISADLAEVLHARASGNPDRRYELPSQPASASPRPAVIREQRPIKKGRGLHQHLSHVRDLVASHTRLQDRSDQLEAEIASLAGRNIFDANFATLMKGLCLVTDGTHKLVATLRRAVAELAEAFEPVAPTARASDAPPPGHPEPDADPFRSDIRRPSDVAKEAADALFAADWFSARGGSAKGQESRSASTRRPIDPATGRAALCVLERLLAQAPRCAPATPGPDGTVSLIQAAQLIDKSRRRSDSLQRQEQHDVPSSDAGTDDPDKIARTGSLTCHVEQIQRAMDRVACSRAEAAASLLCDQPDPATLLSLILLAGLPVPRLDLAPDRSPPVDPITVDQLAQADKE